MGKSKQHATVFMPRQYLQPVAHRFRTGTSFSAPLVAGIAAQLLEADPTLSPAQVKQALLDLGAVGTVLPAPMVWRRSVRVQRFRDGTICQRNLLPFA